MLAGVAAAFCAVAMVPGRAPPSQGRGSNVGCKVTQAKQRIEITTGTFQERKQALMECLSREYKSFFRPFESEFYTKAVTFNDPLNALEGCDSYEANVAMLSGESPVGRILFRDGAIDLHSVEDRGGRHLRTRWTLQFRFNALPWAPLAIFTGISEYKLSSEALVENQQDYWDSINLCGKDAYKVADPSAGVIDMLSQLVPGGVYEEPHCWSLMRRAALYDVRRYPDGEMVAVSTEANDGVAPGSLDARVLEALAQRLQEHGLGIAGEANLALCWCSADSVRPAAEDGAIPSGFQWGLLLETHPWNQDENAPSFPV